MPFLGVLLGLPTADALFPLGKWDNSWQDRDRDRGMGWLPLLTTALSGSRQSLVKAFIHLLHLTIGGNGCVAFCSARRCRQSGNPP